MKSSEAKIFSFGCLAHFMMSWLATSKRSSNMDLIWKGPKEVTSTRWATSQSWFPTSAVKSPLPAMARTVREREREVHF